MPPVRAVDIGGKIQEGGGGGKAGEYLADKDRVVLYKLAETGWLWDQRIAMIATLAFIKRGLGDMFALAEKFLRHKHDLMHKASGWMLHEAGKRDKNKLRAFLDRRHGETPRTMLRYSLEKLGAAERARCMKR